MTAENPVLENESYTYDDVGNRLTAADVSGTWSYNQNNELLGYAEVEYEYDENGNLTEIRVAGSVVWTYTYNAASRLVHVEDGTGTISANYYYDPFGRRLWKEVGGTRIYFFYSDEGLIGEYDANGNDIKTYGYKPDSTWTTDPLFLKQEGEYYFYQNDHLGTPQKLTAVNGSVVWSAQYSSFGKADVQVEAVMNNLRFPGQYEDAETGLYYNWFRYYDPRIGKYLREDPKGLKGGINLFEYALSNPVKNMDVRGLGPHPQHIVTPEEAYRLLERHALNFRLSENKYRNMVPKEVRIELIPDRPNSLFPEYMTFSIGSEDYSYFYTGSLLGRLGFHAFRPGGVKGEDGKVLPDFHNGYVFTCQYGWIDMGHFFQSATVGYHLQMGSVYDRLLKMAITYVGEGVQSLTLLDANHLGIHYERGMATPESARTNEDFNSNELGAAFGIALSGEYSSLPHQDLADFADVQGNISGFDFVLETIWVIQKWKEFLRGSQAIVYKRYDDVYRQLYADIDSMWEGGYPVPPDDPLAEATGVIFKDKYRTRWENVRCDFPGYREYCCCSEVVDECQNFCQAGTCQITKPLWSENP